MSCSSSSNNIRITCMVALVHGHLASATLAENVFDTRYQYYQEDNDRIRVDSDYSLFSVDLSDSLVLDGTLLYSAISGASPNGLPGTTPGGQVPLVYLEDERYATSLGLTGKLADHSLRGGFSYSYESDYTSWGGSLTDTISLNQKNTELVLGFAYTRDRVGANGSTLNELKQSYDWIIGVNQILGPRTLLSANLTLGYKDGFLNDPYKRALIDGEVYREERPGQKFEQLLYLQLTHEMIEDRLSMEVSYRLGHNDQGSVSNTATVAFYQYMFNKAVVLRPSLRLYNQSAANYYDTSFTGDPTYFSSDYRLSAEQTCNLGLQVRWNIIPDKFSLDLGYERFLSRGTDGKTSQAAYPNAHSITAGVHLQF